MGDILSEKTLKELVRIGQLTSEVREINGVPMVVVPNDCQVVNLAGYKFSEYAATPHRKKATVSVLDAASFLEYYTLFSDENSRVFADETKSQVLAILDYHGAGEGGPRWGQHRLRLDLRKSPEWLTWTGHNGQAKKFTQVELAEFIEDNTPDIREPNAATMLELARTLEARTESDFQSAIRTSNGNVQFTYNEQTKGTFGSGKVEIPEQFVIGIPVYVGGARVALTARLRYRINGGKLAIWYDLLRVDQVERDAFMGTLATIKEGLKVNIINGVPA